MIRFIKYYCSKNSFLEHFFFTVLFVFLIFCLLVLGSQDKKVVKTESDTILDSAIALTRYEYSKNNRDLEKIIAYNNGDTVFIKS